MTLKKQQLQEVFSAKKEKEKSPKYHKIKQEAGAWDGGYQ